MLFCYSEHMKIYLSHSGSFDYEAELYVPIKASPLFKDHEFFLPHTPENIDVRAKDIVAKYDLMLGEVSFPSTGQGIEIGLAAAADVPVVCLYREGAKPSSSLRFYSQDLVSYTDTADLLQKITDQVEKQSRLLQ